MGISANWSRENLAWMAGLFEGEGCINTRANGAVILKMGMTDEDVVRKFHAMIGCGTVGNPIYHKTMPHYKPHWDWQVSGSERVQAILAAFWVFLGDRRKSRAIEAIQICSKQNRYGARTRHCSRGHEYSETNTAFVITRGRKARVCKSCAKENMAAWRKKKNNNVSDQLRKPVHGARKCAAQV